MTQGFNVARSMDAIQNRVFSAGSVTRLTTEVVMPGADFYDPRYLVLRVQADAAEGTTFPEDIVDRVAGASYKWFRCITHPAKVDVYIMHTSAPAFGYDPERAG